MQQRFLLSTFGLISPGKGLETAIEALPAIVERHPEVLYLIAGRTHPGSHAGRGSSTACSSSAVWSISTSATTSSSTTASSRSTSWPICSPRRTCSSRRTATASRSPRGRSRSRSPPAVPRSPRRTGTRRTCSSSGAGRLVPFDDSDALAEAVCDLCEQPELLEAARAEARRVGGELAWPRVAEATAVGAAGGRGARTATDLRAARRAGSSPTCGRDHLLTLVDDVGIVQHAHGVIPNRESGYCVDDVARLTVVALELARRYGDQPWNTILYRALGFLHAATPAIVGRGMRNFMSYERRWLDEPHLGDHVGRSVWALGEVLSHRLGARGRRSRPEAARDARRLAPRRRVAAHGGVRGARSGAARPRQARCRGAARAREPRGAARRRVRAERSRRPGAGSRTLSATTMHAFRTPS